MAGLKPYKGQYQAKYPRALSDTEIEEMLRPSLFKRFRDEVMITGAVLTGLMSAGCRSEDEKKSYPPINNSEKSYEEAKAESEIEKTKSSKPQEKTTPQKRPPQMSRAAERKAKAWAKEVLGRMKPGSWNKYAGIDLIRELPANPPLKYPRIEISFGNSYCGIFDIEEAKKITEELFRIYGIELKANVSIKGEGYEFEADGYNKEQKIGFEIVSHGYNPDEKNFKSEALSPLEYKGLNKDVVENKRRIFVANIQQLPNMDGDLYTPKQYYMASVIDYLNWVRGDQLYNPDEVLGTFPIASRSHLQTVLPGSSFPSSQDAPSCWSLGSKTSRFERLNGRLVVKLSPGDTLRYTAKEVITLPIASNGYLPCVVRVFQEDDQARLRVVQIGLFSPDGQYLKTDTKASSTVLNPAIRITEKPVFQSLKSVELKNLGKETAIFRVKDISVGYRKD